MQLKAKAFNTLLGENSEVPAYSNGTPQHISVKPNYIKTHYMGLKWQCVEYARRWIYHTHQLNFSSINYAYDIWTKVDHYFNPATQQKIKIFNHPNQETIAPVVGDLLIYSKGFLQTGHVAIIVEVNLIKGYLRVAEQNYHNQAWPSNYSRQLNLYVHIKKNQPITYKVDDPCLLGWKSLIQKP